MKLTIIETNFFNDKDWVYKLKDNSDNIFYIMDSLFYKEVGVKSPINKSHLDSYDKETVIDVLVEIFEDKKIVMNIF